MVWMWVARGFRQRWRRLRTRSQSPRPGSADQAAGRAIQRWLLMQMTSRRAAPGWIQMATAWPSIRHWRHDQAGRLADSCDGGKVSLTMTLAKQLAPLRRHHHGALGGHGIQ